MKQFLIAASKSKFFTVSLLIHVMIVVLLGTTTLVQNLVEPPDIEGTFEEIVEVPRTVQMPITTAVARLSELHPAFEPMRAQPLPAMQILTTPNPLSEKLPISATRAISPIPQSLPNPTMAGPASLTAELAGEMRAFTGWGSGNEGLGTGKPLHQREFEFTAFLARYGGGNWNSTVQLRDNQITAGSLPNLLYLMTELSGGRIKATPAAKPLTLSSDELFAARPPFIFFTGHRDFTLTEAEVQNLRKYIRLGGAIWGDSQLAGERSRFDIAFRREMKRVMPDRDKEFYPLPDGHPVFSSGYWKEIQSTPPGINHYHLPVYAMDYLGEIAIIYTANNYGDMWQAGLNKNLHFDMRRDAQGRHVAINQSLFQHRGSYIHNVEEESVANSFKFGTNVIMHLITRWEDKLRSAPKL